MGVERTRDVRDRRIERNSHENRKRDGKWNGKHKRKWERDSRCSRSTAIPRTFCESNYEWTPACDSCGPRAGAEGYRRTGTHGARSISTNRTTDQFLARLAPPACLPAWDDLNPCAETGAPGGKALVAEIER